MIKKRNTIQKEIVYNTVCNLKNHPSADEIFGEAKQTCPKISKATVYRILNELATEGIIYHVAVPGRADSYDFNIEPHYHAVCDACGRVSDIDIPYFTLPKVTDDYIGRFEVKNYTLVFNGICDKCKNKKS